MVVTSVKFLGLCVFLILFPYTFFSLSFYLYNIPPIILPPTSLCHFTHLSPVPAPNMFSSIYSFSSLVARHPPDPDLILQVPPAQTFHQISQDSPLHSAAQMRCSESFLAARIPSLASLVSHTKCACYVSMFMIFSIVLCVTVF